MRIWGKGAGYWGAIDRKSTSELEKGIQGMGGLRGGQSEPDRGRGWRSNGSGGRVEAKRWGEESKPRDGVFWGVGWPWGVIRHSEFRFPQETPPWGGRRPREGQGRVLVAQGYPDTSTPLHFLPGRETCFLASAISAHPFPEGGGSSHPLLTSLKCPPRLLGAGAEIASGQDVEHEVRALLRSPRAEAACGGQGRGGVGVRRGVSDGGKEPALGIRIGVSRRD